MSPVRALPLIVLVLLLAVPRARAQTVIRMATPVPIGTSWWREIRQFQQDVEEATKGEVKLKVYFDGVAGDELAVGDRIKREQLDGAFSGGMLCMRLAPSMRVMRVLGLFQGQRELAYVLGRLKAQIDDEFRRAGFYNLGLVGVGPELIFSRKPVQTLAEAKKTKLWSWGVDDTLGPGLTSLGFATVPADVGDAGRLYDARKVDGFIAAPVAALAFQWSARAKYLLPLRLASLDACVIIANRAFDPLPEEHKLAIRRAAARAVTHCDDASRRQDEELLGGLFAKQGVTIVPPSTETRAQFFDESRRLRESAKMPVSRALLDEVLSMLADYRAEHRDAEGNN
jgi:TRAP-type C4-dicarboxylate transport system substrate-binding protein